MVCLRPFNFPSGAEYNLTEHGKEIHPVLASRISSVSTDVRLMHFAERYQWIFSPIEPAHLDY